MRGAKRGFGNYSTMFGIAGLLLLGLQACSMPSAPTDRYAIVIGIAKYQDPNVNTCLLSDNDASSLASTLSASGWNIYNTMISADPSTNGSSVTSVGPSPTKANIKLALSAFAADHPDASTLLVYYSGHGSLTSGTAYICPYDTNNSSTISAFTSSMISVQELDSWLESVPAANKLLVLDSCYSGGYVDKGLSVDATPQAYYGQSIETSLSIAVSDGARLFENAFSTQSDPSILTISAAGSQEESYSDVKTDSYGNILYDSSGNMLGVVNNYATNGVFTWFLLKAFSDASADIDHNGLVTATEAYSYARNGILADWDNKLNGSTFLPHISGGSGDIVLYDKR